MMGKLDRMGERWGVKEKKRDGGVLFRRGLAKVVRPGYFAEWQNHNEGEKAPLHALLSEWVGRQFDFDAMEEEKNSRISQ